MIVIKIKNLLEKHFGNTQQRFGRPWDEPGRKRLEFYEIFRLKISEGVYFSNPPVDVLIKDITTGAGGLGFDSRVGQIGVRSLEQYLLECL